MLHGLCGLRPSSPLPITAPRVAAGSLARGFPPLHPEDRGRRSAHPKPHPAMRRRRRDEPTGRSRPLTTRRSGGGPHGQKTGPVAWPEARPAGETKEKFIAVRCTEADRAKIAGKAQEAGLRIGGYLRALALGSAGVRAVKRPRVEREQLARLLTRLRRERLFDKVGAETVLFNEQAGEACLDTIGDRASLLDCLYNL